MEECDHGDSEWDKVRVMTDILSQIVMGSRMCRYEAVKQIIKRLLLMIDQSKKDHKMDRWLHMSSTDSYEYYFYRMLCGEVEARVCNYFGSDTALDSTEEC